MSLLKAALAQHSGALCGRSAVKDSFAQYSESFSLTPWTKASCQATRRRKLPLMVYLLSKAKQVHLQYGAMFQKL